jgi:hypothetical protein
MPSMLPIASHRSSCSNRIRIQSFDHASQSIHVENRRVDIRLSVETTDFQLFGQARAKSLELRKIPNCFLRVPQQRGNQLGVAKELVAFCQTQKQRDEVSRRDFDVREHDGRLVGGNRRAGSCEIPQLFSGLLRLEAVPRQCRDEFALRSMVRGCVDLRDHSSLERRRVAPKQGICNRELCNQDIGPVINPGFYRSTHLRHQFPFCIGPGCFQACHSPSDTLNDVGAVKAYVIPRVFEQQSSDLRGGVESLTFEFQGEGPGSRESLVTVPGLQKFPKVSRQCHGPAAKGRQAQDGQRPKTNKSTHGKGSMGLSATAQGVRESYQQGSGSCPGGGGSHGQHIGIVTTPGPTPYSAPLATAYAK